ncbi:MAG TPA: type II toxin-antitoxin system VapB family antitoxin [Caulobacter sp.]|nr:type II toxin-antitoxin system VapB family antitoxin [Caulobacter sp.]
MAFHIRDRETDALVRELAEKAHVGITEAVKLAAAEALATRERARAEKLARIDAILAEFDAAPRTGLKADREFIDMINGD